jgi:hypothetical protein
MPIQHPKKMLTRLFVQLSVALRGNIWCGKAYSGANWQQMERNIIIIKFRKG